MEQSQLRPLQLANFLAYLHPRESGQTTLWIELLPATLDQFSQLTWLLRLCIRFIFGFTVVSRMA